MDTDKSKFETAEVTDRDRPGAGSESTEQRKMSRLERLKKKLRKLQGKDPDIYPMW